MWLISDYLRGYSVSTCISDCEVFEWGVCVLWELVEVLCFVQLVWDHDFSLTQLEHKHKSGWLWILC